MHTIAVIRFSSMSRIQPSSRKISGSVSSWRHDAESMQSAIVIE